MTIHTVILLASTSTLGWFAGYEIDNNRYTRGIIILLSIAGLFYGHK
jgi:hypothetical protein